jgi:hypothetical protein
MVGDVALARRAFSIFSRGSNRFALLQRGNDDSESAMTDRIGRVGANSEV